MKRTTAILSLMLTALTLAGAMPSGTGAGGQVRVTMEGFESDEGKALVALFVKEDGFPDDGRKAVARRETLIRNGTAEVLFTDVPAGPYAVAVLHDLNGDYVMETDLLGMPSEGYGVSRDGTRIFGPPRFRDCVLQLAPGERATVRIRIR